MLQVLSKIFVRAFYKANTGFFLFFFFVFFGAVQGGSLVQYHLSLMHSFFSSTIVLLLVFGCWILYHLKCTGFVLKICNSEAGRFLLNLQAIGKAKQVVLYGVLYTALYLPVLLYAVVAAVVALRQGFEGSAAAILLFQVLSLVFFTGVIYLRLNNWLVSFRFPSLRVPVRKTFLLFMFFYFTNRRKNLLLVLKLLSLSLLYIVLVWNKDSYDNDAFLLFYLVLLLAHAAVPYFAVRFWERQLVVYRNLPVSLAARALAYVIPYILLMIPEFMYIIYAADAFSLQTKLAYCLNALASLWLLTAIQYSEVQSRDEYLKACFALIFVSLFTLHVQAFWFWIGVQLVIAVILFGSGYYAFEKPQDE